MNAPSQHPPAVRTTCPYCGVGCGVLAKPDGRGGAAIAGDPEHPANFGRLCSKGSALGETLGLGSRLLHPMRRQADGALTRMSWDAALDEVAAGFARTIDKHGPNSVAFYLSGQLLTEDYYVANKLMKGFLGSANVDTNSRLCMASSVAGHRRAFGSDTVPGNYEDLDRADLIVLVGSNAAWCHPVLYQRMMANKRERGAKIVVVDPRRTATAEDVDLFLPVAPGMDTALFCGLLVHLADTHALDYEYIDAHVTGLPDALARAREIAPDVMATAVATGLAPADVVRFFDLFRDTPNTVTCFSQGVNQSAQGTDKVNAIINCHLATGRIGKEGAGPFSLTGQPNAMGGREVGGLANQLAAHMGFAPEEVDRVGRFWNAPAMARREGLKAVQMFEAIARGEIKALWVMATNPAVSLPRAGVVRDALAKLDLLVVSENVLSNDTVNAGAHLLLPAAAWGEKDGTVTNSERRISRQRPFLPLPGEAKPDWWIVAQVAQRMGFAEAFDYRSAADVFREHARLSMFENGGTRDFDIGVLASLSDESFDGLDPVQWPAPASRSGTERFFAQGGFFTPDRKAKMVAPEPPRPKAETSDEFPLRLNTGRVRDQWHTMTRTGKSPRLADHIAEPFVDMHPQDALLCGVGEGKLARVSTRWGALVARVQHSGGIARGSVFVPIHWNDQFSSDARVGALVNPVVDPLSGEPEFKHTPARVEAFPVSWHGFALSRGELSGNALTYWTRVQGRQFQRYEFAGRENVDDRAAWARALLGITDPDADWIEYEDRSAGIYHAGHVVDDRLQSCIYVATRPELPSRAWLSTLFARERLEDADRIGLLLGQPLEKGVDAGPTVCSCFGVGRNTICDAVRKHNLATPAEITACVKAGGNCGSCVPELKKLLTEIRVAETA